MKLRVKGNTLRLRLTRGEVDAIGRGERVEEATHFPDGSALRYRLQQGEALLAAQSHSAQNHVIRIEVPAGMAVAWAQSEEAVALGGDEPLQIGPLAVLIEKDFTCVTPRAGEEELDTFPNPNAAAAG